MTPNSVALALSRKHGVPYHDIRVAVNRLVNLAGWKRERAETYVDEVLAVHNDLTVAVDAAVTEAAAS